MQLSGTILNRPVLSLHVGRPIATAVSPVINPNNLKIEGFYCEQQKSRTMKILLSQDIRDMLPQGFVVNDEDVLTSPDELIRLKGIINLGFDVIGKQVVTTGKQKLGKVNDYSVDTEGLFIQKLYVTQSIFKSFTGGSLIIDRSQIVEITNKNIIVNDLSQKVPAGARAVA